MTISFHNSEDYAVSIHQGLLRVTYQAFYQYNRCVPRQARGPQSCHHHPFLYLFNRLDLTDLYSFLQQSPAKHHQSVHNPGTLASLIGKLPDTCILDQFDCPSKHMDCRPYLVPVNYS